MSDLSPSLALPLIAPAQAQKHVTHNEALMRLDMLVQPAMADSTLTDPPASPVAGERHLVAPGGTGLWAGQDTAIALYDGVAWLFALPQAGWRVYDIAAASGLVFDGAAWVPEQPNLQNLDGIGVNAASDAINRLVVSSQATLFNHEGAGHQLKINKATVTDTASLLYQTGFSGRAEMGLTGSDAFSIRASADGSTWNTGLSLDPATGVATLPQGAVVAGSLSGTAVQQTPEDATAGRLMRADYGYGPGTALGTVSFNGSTPNGALIEQGSNANGSYTRFADGTQICQHEVTMNYVNGTLFIGTWTFPAVFLAGSKPQVVGTLNPNSLASTAPSITVSQMTGLVVGLVSDTTGKLQVRALTGATFTSGESVLIRAVAVGYWA